MIYGLAQAQHCSPSVFSLNLNECINSSNDGWEPDGGVWPLANRTERATFSSLQGQHLTGLSSQMDFSQTSSHLGLGHRVGFLHFQSHFVSSHIGVHAASGGTHVVWHSAGAHTVSHFGQSSFSHMSFGQRTLHKGFSQWTVQAAHGVSSHCIWHFGRSHTGWHWAGHTGSSHCHLHSGWHVFSAARMTDGVKADSTNSTNTHTRRCIVDCLL